MGRWNKNFPGRKISKNLQSVGDDYSEPESNAFPNNLFLFFTCASVFLSRSAFFYMLNLIFRYILLYILYFFWFEKDLYFVLILLVFFRFALTHFEIDSYFFFFWTRSCNKFVSLLIWLISLLMGNCLCIYVMGDYLCLFLIKCVKMWTYIFTVCLKCTKRLISH